MMPPAHVTDTNAQYLLHNCLWEALLTHAGLTGRDKTAFLEAFYIEMCVQLEARLCLEVGAHEASGLQRLHKVLPEARLIGYEANPYVHQRFVKRLDPAIEYLNQVVSHDDQPKKLKIPRVMPDRNGQRTLPRENLTSSIRPRTLERVEYEEVTVESTTLDDIIAQHPGQTPVCLWIDVEGAAGDVLFGAKRALGNDIALLYMELENRESWKGQWLDLDVARYLTAYQFVPLARDMQTPWQYNQLFIRQHYLGLPAVVSAFKKLLADTLNRATSSPA